MRVIGGLAKGRRLTAPKSGTLRITADRIKESLFDILGQIEGLTFLDLYAGTGNVGIEALSRGVVTCVFVEHNRRHAAVIEKNLALTGLAGGTVVVRAVQRALEALDAAHRRFDIIFADPPYADRLVASTIESISKRTILAPGGMVVVEHSVTEPCENGGMLSVVDRRRYGDTAVTFLTMSE